MNQTEDASLAISAGKMILDRTAARKLAPGKSISVKRHPGLRLEVGQSLLPTWTYRYRAPGLGLMRQIKLGTFPNMSQAQAVAAWEKTRAERADWIDVGARQRAVARETVRVAEAHQQAARETVAWLVNEYLTGVVEGKRKAKGAAESRRMLERATARWAATPARELTRDQAHTTMVAAVAKTAPRVAAMTRQELRAAWEHGLARGLVDVNVFAGRTVGGRFTAKKRERFLSDAEAAELLKWWRQPGAHSRTVSDALELVLRTGLRSGEVCAIHASELHERHGVLWLDIPASRMKGGQPHSTPLVGRAREIVDTRKGAGGFLFPSRVGDKPIAQKALGVEVYASRYGGSGAPRDANSATVSHRSGILCAPLA
jgi:integrase